MSDSPDELLEPTLAVLAARAPEVAAAVRSAPRLEDVEAVEGVPRPTLRIAGVQLAGAVEPEAEAALQAARIPAGARAATVYEPAQGHLPRALLARPELERLDVVLLDPAVFGLVAAVLDQRDWLTDPRVRVRLVEPDERPRAPWTLSPAGLRLCARSGWALRDRLVLELSAAHQSRVFAGRAAGQLAQAEVLADRFGQDRPVRELFGSRPGAHAVVVGSGPSLDDSIAWLAGARADLFVAATNSALRPLVRRGVVPDVVVAIDPLPILASHLMPPEGADEDAWWRALAEVPLVYASTIASETRQAWRGPAYAAHLAQPLYDALEAKRPLGRLFCGGTVLHAAADLAALAGAGRLTLLGADFGYPGGKSHAAAAPAERAVGSSRLRLEVLDGHGAPIESEVNLVGYLRDLEDWIARHPRLRVGKRGRSGAAVRGAPFEDELA